MSYYVVFSGVFSWLEDAGFEAVKKKFAENRNYFLSKTTDKLTKELFDIAFCSESREKIDRKQFGTIIECFYLEKDRYLIWFDRYCEILCKTFNGLYSQISDDQRAVNYHRHLFQVLIPELREQVKKDDGQFQFILHLIDINKILCSLVLYAYSVNKTFTLNIGHRDLSNMESRITGYLNNHTKEYSYKERVYLVLICWIIEELICQEDGIPAEGGEEECCRM